MALNMAKTDSNVKDDQVVRRAVLNDDHVAKKCRASDANISSYHQCKEKQGVHDSSDDSSKSKTRFEKNGDVHDATGRSEMLQKCQNVDVPIRFRSLCNCRANGSHQMIQTLERQQSRPSAQRSRQEQSP